MQTTVWNSRELLELLATELRRLVDEMTNSQKEKSRVHCCDSMFFVKHRKGSFCILFFCSKKIQKIFRVLRRGQRGNRSDFTPCKHAPASPNKSKLVNNTSQFSQNGDILQSHFPILPLPITCLCHPRLRQRPIPSSPRNPAKQLRHS